MLWTGPFIEMLLELKKPLWYVAPKEVLPLYPCLGDEPKLNWDNFGVKIVARACGIMLYGFIAPFYGGNLSVLKSTLER